MRYVQALWLAAVIVCAFAAAAQAALPEFGGTIPDEASLASTGPKFENVGSKLKLSCTSSEGTVKVLTVKVVDFDELFLGCEAELGTTKLGKCTGLADTTTGSILAKGSATLGFVLGGLVPIEAASYTELHYECPLGTLVVVRGCLVGQITLLKSLKATVTFKGSEGIQELTDYTNDAGTMVSCKLESSLNGGAFSAADQLQVANVTLAKELEVKD